MVPDSGYPYNTNDATVGVVQTPRNAPKNRLLFVRARAKMFADMDNPEMPELNEARSEEVTPEFSPEAVFAFLRGLGISEQQIAALMMAVAKWTPRVIDEAIRETWRYAKEDQSLVDAHIRHTTEMRELMIMTVTSSRGFFLALTTLSMTVIGLAVTQLKGSTGYFGIPWLAVVGCVLLSTCVLISICYLCVVHASEYDKLAGQSWKQRKLLRDLRALNKEMHGKAQSFDAYVVAKNALVVSLEQENSESEAPRASWFRAINVATGLFVFGLLAVGSSMLF